MLASLSGGLIISIPTLLVDYYYITSATFTPDDHSRLKDLDGFDERFHFLDVVAISEKLDERRRPIPLSIDGKEFRLRARDKSMIIDNTTAVIAVRLSDIHDLVQAGQEGIFASNVRQYLGATKINKKISLTLQREPENFWLYNNGITMVCDKFEPTSSHLRVVTPQIVNGCQTAKTIWEVLSMQTKEQREALRGYVLVRVIQGTQEDLRRNITKYTNSQNAIRGKDFFALEDFHSNLQYGFSNYGYYYEIQRGSFSALKPSERYQYTGVPGLSYLHSSSFNCMIPAMEASQAFAAAFRQMPGVAYGFATKLSPIGEYYGTVFDEELNADPRWFLYPFLVKQWTKLDGYGKSPGSWRVNATYFFVHAYFMLVTEFIKGTGVVNTDLDQLL
jgi:hypothetical protein